VAIKGNIVIDQGTDYIIAVNVETANNTVANLVGYSATAQMRKHYTSLTYYTFSTEIDTQFGAVNLSMTANTTNNIPSGRYVYDCEIVSPLGVRSRLIEGIATVTPQVTR
jgi:hypothetical protein